MSNTHFTFKQFSIHQERCAMKVGTDGCLLGAWAKLEGCNRVLDIGCGSGLIAIMAAQRCDAQITGVEIDADAAAQAQENVDNTAWAKRIEIINCDIKNYTPKERFDAIVSNPPFFANSLKCPEEKRTQARHSDSLTCEVLMQCAKELLTDTGTLSVVIPTDAVDTWRDEALFKGLSTRRITYVRTLPHKQPKRVLVEFTKCACPQPETEDFILEDSPGIYSHKARTLLKEFYLKI